MSRKYSKWTALVIVIQIIFIVYTGFLVFIHPQLSDKQIVNTKLKAFRIPYYLYIVILSHPKNTDRRNCIRKTWLSTIDTTYSGVGYKFVIGLLDDKNENDYIIYDEMQRHTDIILFNNILEHPRALSKKVIETFKWLDSNIDTTYVLKCDDDSYVVLDKLAGTIQTEDLPIKRYYWGYFNGKGRPHMIGKWMERQWFLCDTYIPFALGGGYILTADLVHYISINEEYFKLYNNEDVNIGTILAPIDITRRHDRRFNTEYMSRGCSNEYIVSHKHNIEEMETMHRNWLKTGNICIEEKIERLAYNYDWNSLPSQCCTKSLNFNY